MPLDDVDETLAGAFGTTLIELSARHVVGTTAPILKKSAVTMDGLIPTIIIHPRTQTAPIRTLAMTIDGYENIALGWPEEVTPRSAFEAEQTTTATMTMTTKTQLSATTKDLDDVEARGQSPEDVTLGPASNEDSATTITKDPHDVEAGDAPRGEAIHAPTFEEKQAAATLKTMTTTTITKDPDDAVAQDVPAEEAIRAAAFEEKQTATILTMTMTVTVVKRPACPVIHQQD